jgi:hypothetical protein
MYGTFGSFWKSNFGFHHIEDSSCGGRWIEFNSVILAVHEMEPGVNGAPVDGAHDFLLGGRPLSPPCALSAMQTLKHTHFLWLVTKSQEELNGKFPT